MQTTTVGGAVLPHAPPDQHGYGCYGDHGRPSDGAIPGAQEYLQREPKGMIEKAAEK